MSYPESILTVPGGALLALRQIRTGNAPVRAAIAELQATADLADLRALIRQHSLPEPQLVLHRLCGVVGTFRGTDKAVRYAVEEWAQAFATEAAVVEPVWRFGTFACQGWAVMHGSVGGLRFTVGGRLVENGGRSR